MLPLVEEYETKMRVLKVKATSLLRLMSDLLNISASDDELAKVWRQLLETFGTDTSRYGVELEGEYGNLQHQLRWARDQEREKEVKHENV